MGKEVEKEVVNHKADRQYELRFARRGRRYERQRREAMARRGQS